MKNLLIYTIFLFFGISSFSQTINNTPISEIDAEYIQIKGISAFNSFKIKVMIDFGQEMKYYTNGEIKGKDGKKVKFNSMIGALNFMSKNGYNFIQAYSMSVGNNEVYYHIMKKKEKGFDKE